MNIITDTLPDSVEYNGTNYAVKTDFKVWLKFHSIITDDNKTPAEKSIESILCCFDSKRCKSLPDTIDDAMALLLQFFCGQTEENGGKKASKCEKVFDFTEDSGYIYAAFLQDYGIDLVKSSMHWYRFLALLNGLKEDTQLRKVIAWRGVNLSLIKDSERREFYRKMKSRYRLKNVRVKGLDESDIASEMSRAF